jgi:hypothetical protein
VTVALVSNHLPEPEVGQGIPQNHLSVPVSKSIAIVAILSLAIIAEEEGVRRSLCDMTLLIFHLVLSSFTFGVDLSMAQRILEWNLKRYPEGIRCYFT